MSFTIAIEPPRQPEIEDLLVQSTLYAESLYPPESNFLLSIEELERPDVLFYVTRSEDGTAIGTAAIVDDGSGAAELKRMFVSEVARGRGVGRAIIARIETDAVERGIRRIVLETGDLHHPAQALYTRAGYTLIPQFGQYVGEAHSVCFAKELATAS